MQLESILNQIELGNFALPEFQRGYVWNREQVRKLMNSLYKGYPIGSLLTWITPIDSSVIRNAESGTPIYGNVELLLDGQQRITSLYGIIKGKAPKFFDGNKNSFTGLYFNLDTETFEFYLPLKMKDDSSWISVTKLMQLGSGPFVSQAPDTETMMYYVKNMEKLAKFDQIKKSDLYIEKVVGEDKTIDVVVEIFNNVINAIGIIIILRLTAILYQWMAYFILFTFYIVFFRRISIRAGNVASGETTILSEKNILSV